MEDSIFMEMALELAAKGEGYTSPNPVVGAVVVKDGKVVGRGFHEAAGKPHAEAVAIEDAGPLARGSVLYVTLEPCNHTGRTPPCTAKILEAGIARVVVGTRDPNPHVAGGGIEFLKAHGVEVTEGVCGKEARKQIEWFIKHVTTGTPFVTVKCAMTLDGRIATRIGDSKWVSGEESRAFVHRMRHASDAIMVGVGTVNTDNPRLTARVDGMKTVDPMRIVLDSKLSVREDALIFDLDSSAKTVLVTTGGGDPEKRARLSEKAVIVDIEAENGMVSLPVLMKYLGGIGVTSLLVEGGAHVIGSALAGRIVDKVNFFYAPKILGGDDGVPVCCGRGPEFMSDAIGITDLSVRRFGEDVMIEGYVA